MTHEITLAQFRRWLRLLIDRVVEQEAYLAELDAAIGDGDHGANLVRGFSKVRDWLENDGQSAADIGTLLRTVGMILIGNVGGASGPLYGAFFLRAAKEASGQESVTLPQLSQMMQSGLEGVQQRGKAQVGEKTMIDTMHPAVASLAATAAKGESVAAALNAAAQAATAGMRHTVALEATKGRASYLGIRSIGHQDPGATSASFLFETAAQTLGT